MPVSAVRKCPCCGKKLFVYVDSEGVFLDEVIEDDD